MDNVTTVLGYALLGLLFVSVLIIPAFAILTIYLLGSDKTDETW